MEEELKDRVLQLNHLLWEERAKWSQVVAWLDNFRGEIADIETEKTHALYLLTNFLYFGSRQIRELLKALYRDFVLYPALGDARRLAGVGADKAALMASLKTVMDGTRILGVGNPSESGTHLLYFFRQENFLGKEVFSETHKIFRRDAAGTAVSLRDNSIRRYIFLDDLCGSGVQAEEYSKDLVEEMLRLDPDVRVEYYSLFATSAGIETVRSNTLFTTADAVYELDETYKVFNSQSRTLSNLPPGMDTDVLLRMAKHYGEKLFPEHCLGYMDSQLLIGFHHNTPDNTLPIMWCGEFGSGWQPMFKRYPKSYGGWGS